VGGVPGGHISADYFAVFADRIQELLKADRQDPPFVGIMSNGTSGDVNNRNYGDPEGEGPRTYSQMRRVADDVVREVFRALTKVEYHDWVKLQAAQEELALQARKPGQEMIGHAEGVMKMPDDKIIGPHRSEKFYNRRILDLKDGPDKTDIILQAFRIGDLCVAAIPFETFAETGLEIKEKSPFSQTFTVELANGWNGYLPTPGQHKLGGYETWLSINRVEVDASDKIVATLLELFEKIK
jgi:hypothetical protein